MLVIWYAHSVSTVKEFNIFRNGLKPCNEIFYFQTTNQSFALVKCNIPGQRNVFPPHFHGVVRNDSWCVIQLKR